MKSLKKMLAVAVCVLITVGPAHAQNWVLSIKDSANGTPINQANGVSGATATLYGNIVNFTGTIVSDDGTGYPAGATALDFGGFGFAQGTSQYDLGSLFTPAVPGYPQVLGSANGSDPGVSGYVSLGTFDLSGLAPGTYEEDFISSAFSDDAASTVLFGDITGTLTLQVNSAPVPEASTAVGFGLGLLPLVLVAVRRQVKRKAGC